MFNVEKYSVTLGLVHAVLSTDIIVHLQDSSKETLLTWGTKSFPQIRNPFCILGGRAVFLNFDPKSKLVKPKSHIFLGEGVVVPKNLYFQSISSQTLYGSPGGNHNETKGKVPVTTTIRWILNNTSDLQISNDFVYTEEKREQISCVKLVFFNVYVEKYNRVCQLKIRLPTSCPAWG